MLLGPFFHLRPLGGHGSLKGSESSLWRGKRHDQDSVLAIWLIWRRLTRCLGQSMPCFINETVSEAEPKRGSPSMASYLKGFSDLR